MKARIALITFITRNQCPHCSGLTTKAWELAESFARREGLMFMFPMAPPVCPGYCGDQIGERTASDLEDELQAVPRSLRRVA